MRAYQFLFEQMVTSQEYYHVTFKTRLAAIKKQGLIVGKKRNWENTFGGKLGQSKLYFFVDLTGAVRWAHKMNYDFKRPVIILVCQFDNETLPDENSQARMTGNAVAINQSIPANCIKGYIIPDITLFRQVVNGGTVTEPPKINLLEDSKLDYCR